MNHHVLLLNADYSAMGVCTVERAVVLVFLGKADVVQALDGQFLRSARTRFPMPSIVRLRAYIRVPYRSTLLTRKNVLRRDHHRCQYCGTREHLTIDHVMPKSRGGKDTWENLVAACSRCNARKGSRTPDEAHMPLLGHPFRPSHVMFIRDFVGNVDDTWKPYLFLT
ncbi:MAG: HNH endonuclease [Bacteroidetes bacterium]|nr:HNH endonuclease [Bacteroidota bacterium]